MKRKINLVFMGTPDFAVPALEALAAGPMQVCLVVTQPDRRRGRGRKWASPPVKKAAAGLGIEVVQPPSVRQTDFIARIEELDPDLLVVVAFGQILPPALLAIAANGAVNLHASLLPRYRGAAPIQWALINGESTTGITVMRMDRGLDTGDIIESARLDIRPDDNAATLHDRLADLGARMLPKTLPAWLEGRIQPVSQCHQEASYAPPLKKADGRIDWRQPARSIVNLIRGMTPWPGAFTFHDDRRLKILSARTGSRRHTEPPGTVLRSFPGELDIAAGSGTLSILTLQGPSGKRLAIADFLRGCPLPAGSRLA